MQRDCQCALLMTFAVLPMTTRMPGNCFWTTLRNQESVMHKSLTSTAFEDSPLRKLTR